MARISSYPVVTPKAIDTLIISQGYDIDADNPIEGNPTGSVTIGSVIDLVNTGLVPGTGTVTSLGVSMPSAFTVSNSPVTSTGIINITGSGTSTQYIDGTGSLQLSPNQSLNTTDNVVFNSIAGDGALVTNIDKYTTSYIDTNIYTKTEADYLFNRSTKNYESVDSLKSSLDSVVQGDLLHMKDTSIDYEVKRPLKSIITFEDKVGGGDITSYRITTSDGVASGLDYVAGDTLEVDCFFDDSIQENPNFMYLLNVGAYYVLIDRVADTSTVSVFNQSSSAEFLGNFRVFLEGGQEVPETEIPLNKWVTIRVELLQDYTASNVTIHKFYKAEGSYFKASRFQTKGEEWLFAEGQGESIVSNLGSTMTNIRPTTSPTQWSEESVAGGIYLKEEVDGMYLEGLEPTNNIVTPQSFGYIDNRLSTDNTSDAYPYIQACLDSEYDVYIPAGNYYISKELKATKPKNITLAGSFVLNERISDYIESETLQRSIARIWTDQNIHMFTILTAGITVQGGWLDARSIPLHTRAGYRVSIATKIWGLHLSNIWVSGNKDSMITQVGVGTIGLYIDTQSNIFENVSRTSYDSNKVGTLTFESTANLDSYGLEVGSIYYVHNTSYATGTREEFEDTVKVLSIDNVSKTMSVRAISSFTTETTGLIFSEPSVKGYLYEGNFTGYIENCAKGIYQGASPIYTSITNNDFHMSLIRCKEYISMTDTSQCSFKAMLQDGSILPEGEKELYMATFNVKQCYIDVYSVDRLKGTVAPYTHVINQFYIAEDNILGAMMIVREAEKDSIILSNNSAGNWIQDPQRFDISSSKDNFHSPSQSQKSMAAYEDGFSITKYEAPDDAWFSNPINYLPANTAGIPLTELTDGDATVQIYNDSMFKGFWGRDWFWPKSRTAFVEFVVPFNGDGIWSLGYRLSGKSPRFFQIILLGVSDNVLYNSLVSEPSLGKLLSHREYYEILGVYKAIIRVVGNNSELVTDQALTLIDDIYFQIDRSEVAPFIRTGGNQSFAGILDMSKGSIIDKNSISNNRTYREVTAEGDILLTDYGDTVYINNTSGTDKILSFTSDNLTDSTAGREVTFILTSSVYAGMSDSANMVVIKSDNIMTSTVGNTTMVAGDWITFKVLGINTDTNKISLMETGRGSLITDGILLPRMTTVEINAISSPQNGLIVYNTTLNTLCFFNGSSWQKVSHTAM